MAFGVPGYERAPTMLYLTVPESDASLKLSDIFLFLIMSDRYAW